MPWRRSFCWWGMMLILPPLAIGQGNPLAARLESFFAGSGQAGSARGKLKAHEYEALLEMLRSRAALHVSEQAEAAALEGSVAFLAGQMQESITDFGHATQLAPLRDSDTFTMAMAYVRLGDHRHAADLLTRLSSQHPDRPLYVYWLGRINYDLRRYAESVQQLRRAVDLDAASARAWDSLGLALDMEGQSEPAGDAFRKAAELNRALPRPSAWPPHDLGKWLLRVDELREAENALREALQYEPNLADGHYLLGRVLEKSGRVEPAVAEYKAAIAFKDSGAEPCYSLAMLYRKLHRDEEASNTFAEYRRRKAQPTPGPEPTESR